MTVALLMAVAVCVVAEDPPGSNNNNINNKGAEKFGRKGKGTGGGRDANGNKLSPEERKANKEAKRAERRAEKDGHGGGKGRHGNMDRNMERNKAMALFPAMLTPVAPKKVDIPLSESDSIIYHASKDALMAFAAAKGKDIDMEKDEDKTKLRADVTTNNQKAQELVLAAVKGGMSVQQATVGIALAQMEELQKTNPEMYKEHMEKSKAQMEKMSAEKKTKMNTRMETRHTSEKKKIEELGTPEKVEGWVKKMYKTDKMPRMLQERRGKMTAEERQAKQAERKAKAEERRAAKLAEKDAAKKQ